MLKNSLFFLIYSLSFRQTTLGEFADADVIIGAAGLQALSPRLPLVSLLSTARSRLLYSGTITATASDDADERRFSLSRRSGRGCTTSRTLLRKSGSTASRRPATTRPTSPGSSTRTRLYQSPHTLLFPESATIVRSRDNAHGGGRIVV